jgi:glutamyl/glutaminyl-tRNA synthetase
MQHKRYEGNFIVRWTDLDGTRKKKAYDDWDVAQKAFRWLGSNGVKDADIAVKSPKTDKDDSMFPVKED